MASLAISTETSSPLPQREKHNSESASKTVEPETSISAAINSFRETCGNSKIPAEHPIFKTLAQVLLLDAEELYVASEVLDETFYLYENDDEDDEEDRSYDCDDSDEYSDYGYSSGGSRIGRQANITAPKYKEPTFTAQSMVNYYTSERNVDWSLMDAAKVVNVEFGREFAITESVLFLRSVVAEMY